MRAFLLIVMLSVGFAGFAQQLETVDIKRISAVVEPVSSTEMVIGRVEVTFEIKNPADSIYLNAHNFKIYEHPDFSFRASATDDKVWLRGPFEASQTYTMGFDYNVSPSQTLYFTGDQIWTQGQGKYTSHWLPSIDDMNEKIEFDLEIVADRSKSVIANGVLKKLDQNEGGIGRYWIFDMEKPMSSYLVAFAIGEFDVERIESGSGIPIELYYRPEDSLRAEPTYRYTKEIFDFLERKIGVPYPWQNYKQVPVRDFLYAGMENTTATIFSEAFVVDSIGFNDRNYVNVNAHELAHQWFGNLVTETDASNHWLHEGFATYYALLAEREIFGEDYYYWKLYQSAEQLSALSDQGKGESLLDPKASSLTFYEKGAWALHILNELIGEEHFDLAIKNYLNKYAFANVTVDDFVAEVEAVTPVILTNWRDDWLEQSAFKSEQAYNSLVKSDFMEHFFAISALRETVMDDKRDLLLDALREGNEFIGQEVVNQLQLEPLEQIVDLYKRAFETNNLFVRQALAQSFKSVPLGLQLEYESLLDDPSYFTKEIALGNLWSSFPNNRHRYLNKLEGIKGFKNRNIRQLWLVFALITTDYKTEFSDDYLDELISYSGSSYSFEVRQIALMYLVELRFMDESVLRNLINACAHHNWQFRNSSRKLLQYVLESEQNLELARKIKDSLTEEEQYYLFKNFRLD